MTSVEEFNCILCKETFENKDELQIHFRKHGDPKFNESIKTKSRVQNEAPLANEKSNDASEMVNCDVCDEVFPTISKAITHKHKVHPEHDAKYFCPWCGKLFTLKHLYNKHLQTNHEATDEVPGSKDSHFHCDSCSVIFVVPSAMVYHNKFFHRQDTDLPIIGHSKKQKMVNQDLMPVYYCSFCGEEYINKVNLHKHMCDDHEDENQRPTDVLRCPLCEAIFYHLDAYELHLTFHSSGDLYSETNEMNEKEMTEFSLETAPPLMERIEDLNNLPDVETDVNAVGIESFLQMAMDEPKDSDHLPGKKSKKHKKRKKSKKSAITLDEFLSMNQDVFGEDLDFQGVEEVPTKVITKQLKVKKKPIPKPGANLVSSADLQKLQKLGIAVKVPSGNKPLITKVKPIGQPIKVNPQVQNLAKHIIPNPISASNDVLSKLLSQSSSQLKIVKKSAQEKTPEDETDFKEKTQIQHPSDTDEMLTKTPKSMETNSQEKEEKDIDHRSVTHLSIPKTSPINCQECNDKDALKIGDDKNNDILNKQCAIVTPNDSSNVLTGQIELPNITSRVVPAGHNMNDRIINIGKQITIKSITQPAPHIEERTANPATLEKNETEETDDDKKNSSDLNAEQINVSQKTTTLDTLKNLNNAITIKSLKNVSAPENNKNSTTSNYKTDEIYKKDTPDNAVNSHVQKLNLETTAEILSKDSCVHKTSPARMLQNINKNITIKSMSPSIKHQMEELSSKESNYSDFDNPEDDTLIKRQGNNKGKTVMGPSAPTTSSSNVLKNISKNLTIKPMSPALKHSEEDMPSDEHNDSDFESPQDDTLIRNRQNNTAHKVTAQPAPMASSHVLKNISKNIIVKPMSPLSKQPKEDIPNDEHDSDFNISEDDTLIDHKTKVEKIKQQSGQMSSTSQVLKNISKNITIKSMSPLEKQSKDVSSDDYDGVFDNLADDIPMETKNISNKYKELSPTASSSLVYISKNLTVKPMSPKITQTREDVPLDENSDFDNFQDDTPTIYQNDNAAVMDKLKNLNASLKSNLIIKPHHSNYQTKKTVGNIAENFTDDGPCAKNNECKNTNIQTSNNILKNLKNITAKPVQTNKSVSQQVIAQTAKPSSIKENNVIKKLIHTKEMNQDIEIYNIDDSDDEYEKQKANETELSHVNKEPVKANVKPAVLNAIKNMSKHITVKPSNNQMTLKETVKSEDIFSDQFSDEDVMQDDGENASYDDFEQMLETSHNPTLNKKSTYNKNDYYNNVFKQLGQHVTVKSKNAFNQPIKSKIPSLHDFNQGNVAHDTDSDEESYTGRVKITEVTEDDEDINHTNNGNDEGIVTQSPEESNSGDEQFTKGVEDMDEISSQNMKFKVNENMKPNSQGLLKSIGKNITVKSLGEKTTDTSDNGSISNQNLCKDLIIKPVKQNRPHFENVTEKSRNPNMSNNKRNDGIGTAGPSISNVQPKFIKPGALNTVNKEVKVKTFQSETVIEEITTTVTKTIRRVNQTTVNQQVFNASKVSPAPRMVKPQASPRMPNIYSSNNLKGLTVRQPTPRAVRPQIRQPVNVRPPSSTVVRPPVSNQLVPVRPGVTPIRPMNTPRMPVKNMPRQPRPAGPRPLKISPNVVNQNLKRPCNEEPPGHFSCFKKPKESLFPGNETAGISSNFQYASTSQTSKFCSTSQTMKGNTVVTSTQMKAQSVTQQQQINRLGNISGLKVAKTCHVSKVEKSEVSASKRSAMEAIEKLQKQGLLIKKPRVEEDPDPQNSDGEEQFNDDDYDE